MPNPNTRYASYLLRLWQVQTDQQATWVASVQSTATGEQRSFPSVGALVQFLQTELVAYERASEPEPLTLHELAPVADRGTQRRAEE